MIVIVGSNTNRRTGSEGAGAKQISRIRFNGSADSAHRQDQAAPGSRVYGLGLRFWGLGSARL